MNNRQISLVLSGLLFAAHIAILGLVSPRTARVDLSNLVQLLSAALAAGVSFVLALRSRKFQRSVWSTAGCSFLIWTVAQACWTYGEFFTGTPQSGYNATDLLFFFSFTPLLFLLLLSSDRDVEWERRLDLVQIGIVLFCAYLMFFYFPARSETAEQGIIRLVVYVFAYRNIVIAGLLCTRLLLTRSRQERSLFGLMAGFMWLYALATWVANHGRITLHLGSGTWFDLGWAIPFLVFSVAAFYWPVPQDAVDDLERSRGVRGLLSGQIIPTVIPILVLIMAAQISRQSELAAFLVILASFLTYSLRLAVTQRKQQGAVEAMLETERRFRLLFASSPFSMWVFDRSSLRFLEVNEAAVRKYGYTRDEFLQMTLEDIRPEEDLPRLRDVIANQKDSPFAGEWRHVTRTGELRDVCITAEPIRFAGHDAVLAIAQDITESKQLEEKLRQAQKMEAVGNLAGGIAHDFNNLLTVISGYSQVILEQIPPDDRLRHEVQQIENASHRATTLVRQLLAFSRRQMVQPQIVNVEEILSGVEKMLRRLIGEHIRLATSCSPRLYRVKADPGQLEQILINLAVNSRDAMPNGGSLSFELKNVELTDAQTQSFGGPAGGYVEIIVRDTGTGMEASVLEHIFEPFYTTKRGAGTGLGLSTVYGIVSQCGGVISVQSRVGEGTTFRVLLPRAEGDPTPANDTDTRQAAGGNETVLLVEDDDGLRELARRVLMRAGYKVLEARQAYQAEELAAQNAGKIDLLLTDVVMPGVSGRELAVRLAIKHPEMRILYMSGYTDEIVVKQGVMDGSMNFLHKPFTPSKLARTVRLVLDGSPSATFGD